MSEGTTSRLIAWSRELSAAHERLRAALRAARETADGDPQSAGRDLLLYCHGFCTALDGHHRGEDRHLFSALVAEHPELGPVVERLAQDHRMIDHLVGELAAAVERGSPAVVLHRHLEGIEAIMESHFRYEERQLLGLLDTLDLRVGVTEVLGPL